MQLNLYAIFHLNLAFSPIEEDQRLQVLESCYWPLLRLIHEQRLPIGVEASAYTLEMISELDPGWIDELKSLCLNGPAEFIGSGYAQLIGPLVPAKVNRANQQIGQQIYQRLLGIHPGIALVNEQAYSAGMIEHYQQADYRAIIMEWDNSVRGKASWGNEWRYYPQLAKGMGKSSLPVIWNKTIPFQKFQRYAHGEIELEEYLEFLKSHLSDRPRTFSVYGNDAEIFDFRPGRFKTEALLNAKGEWQRIALLFERLRSEENFSMIAPSQVLDFLSDKEAGHLICLESAQEPIPVKKQQKYNVTRWAVSGRDDLQLNTDCWCIYEALAASGSEGQAKWKELCFLWSSDFRTHITESRWDGCLKRINTLKSELCAPVVGPSSVMGKGGGGIAKEVCVREEGRYLLLESVHALLKLNLHRGLAIDSLGFPGCASTPLLGTLEHGFFHDISFGADYYSGHTVLEAPGMHKVTDLQRVVPQVEYRDGDVVVTGTIETELGPLTKEIQLRSWSPEVVLSYRFYWTICPQGSLRLGFITLFPDAFEQKSLFFKTHNGGETAESFSVDGEGLDLFAPVSTLVSARQGLGVTEGIVVIGDKHKSISVQVDKRKAALLGLVMFQPVEDKYLFRLGFSAMESDETSLKVKERTSFADKEITVRIALGDLSN